MKITLEIEHMTEEEELSQHIFALSSFSPSLEKKKEQAKSERAVNKVKQ